MGSAGWFIALLVGILAAIWGLAVLGSEDAATDEIIARSGIGVASLLSLFAIYARGYKTIPEEWDRSSREKISDLEATLVPSIDFEYRPTDNKYLDKVDIKNSRGHYRKYWVGRVSIKNTSLSETSEDVEVTLVHYREENGSRPFVTVDKKLVAHSIGRPVVDVHPNRAENFNVFRALDNIPIRTVQLGLFPDETFESLEPGKYVIKVTVSAKSQPHRYQLYFLAFGGSDTITFRPWKAGDTSHDIKETSR